MLNRGAIADVFPGLALSIGIAGISQALEGAEVRLFGAAWVDGLVLAIVLGTLLHTLWGLPARYAAGVQFAAKTVLEIAIVLLGASISAASLAASGIATIGAVVAVVVASLGLSYGAGRLLGLDDRLATLVSCGNSICGNSAILATAPVIEAEAEDVAAAIAFTAALGVVAVLVLPGTMRLFGLSEWQYGVVAGLSVYAVPQVLAATLPVSLVSAQVGTLVKLIRVLMLGPVLLLIGLKRGAGGAVRVPWSHLVPWFVVGFLVTMAARSCGMVPDKAEPSIRLLSTLLTVVSMAALGLSVNLRAVLASGGRVLAAGAISIGMLVALSTLAARLLQHG